MHPLPEVIHPRVGDMLSIIYRRFFVNTSLTQFLQAFPTRHASCISSIRFDELSKDRQNELTTLSM